MLLIRVEGGGGGADEDRDCQQETITPAGEWNAPSSTSFDPQMNYEKPSSYTRVVMYMCIVHY